MMLKIVIKIIVLILLFSPFSSCANVYLLVPNKGPRLGGSTVTVNGGGFNIRTSVFKFGSRQASCRFISTSIAICVSPGFESAESVAVEVSIDNSEQHSFDRIFFRYQGFPLQSDPLNRLIYLNYDNFFQF